MSLHPSSIYPSIHLSISLSLSLSLSPPPFLPSSLPPSLPPSLSLPLPVFSLLQKVPNESSTTPSLEGGSRLLFLDGGGIKGLAQIEALMRLEEATGRNITELFDWIIGTSTGGIIALGLVYG